MGSFATEELSLHWKDFESNLAKYVSEMRNDSDFFDVEIACFDNKSEMQTISAHKMVLSACSSVFKNLLHAIDNGDSKIPCYFLGVFHTMILVPFWTSCTVVKPKFHPMNWIPF